MPVLRKVWRGMVGRRGEGAASGHSRLSCRLRIRSLHGLFLIQCSRDGNTMVPKWGSNTSSWLEKKSARSDTGSQGQTYKKKNFFLSPLLLFFYIRGFRWLLLSCNLPFFFFYLPLTPDWPKGSCCAGLPGSGLLCHVLCMKMMGR